MHYLASCSLLTHFSPFGNESSQTTVSLLVFVTVSHYLMLFVGRDRWFFLCTSLFFSAPFDLLSGRRDISSHFLLACYNLVAHPVGIRVFFHRKQPCCSVCLYCAQF